MKAAASVILGYVASIAIATVAVWLRAFLFPLPPAEASGGMAAFGDFLLFVGVFSLSAIVPTALLLRILQGSPAFWIVWSSVAVFLTATGLVAGAAYLAPSLMGSQQFPMIHMLAPLRVLGTVPLVIGFILSALLAPQRGTKKIFLGCIGVEFVTFTAALLKLVLSRA